MLIKVNLMKIFDEIETKKNILGKIFFEKIFMCIDFNNNNHKSRFSEFETNGIYVESKFPNIYRFRN